MSLTRATITVTCCFLVCVGPITVWNVLNRSDMNPSIGLGLYCVYWIQYCINFFIYGFQSAQFRKAYIDFLSKPWKALSKVDPASAPSYQTILKIILRMPQPPPQKMVNSNSSSTISEPTPSCCSLCELVQENDNQ